MGAAGCYSTVPIFKNAALELRLTQRVNLAQTHGKVLFFFVLYSKYNWLILSPHSRKVGGFDLVFSRYSGFLPKCMDMHMRQTFHLWSCLKKDGCMDGHYTIQLQVFTHASLQCSSHPQLFKRKSRISWEQNNSRYVLFFPSHLNSAQEVWKSITLPTCAAQVCMYTVEFP